MVTFPPLAPEDGALPPCTVALPPVLPLVVEAPARKLRFVPCAALSPA